MADPGNSRDLDNAKILSTLSYETLRQLSLRLDVISPAFPVDWRALADVIGFSPLVISNILGANARGDKTQWLLEVWERCTTDASVKKLILALACLDLQACLDIVKRDKNIQGELQRGNYFQFQFMTIITCLHCRVIIWRSYGNISDQVQAGRLGKICV